MTEDESLVTDLNSFEGSVEDHPNPHQHQHYAVESEWNGIESDFFIDKTPSEVEQHQHQIYEPNNNNFQLQNNNNINPSTDCKEPITSSHTSPEHSSYHIDDNETTVFSDPEVDHHLELESSPEATRKIVQRSRSFNQSSAPNNMAISID